MTRRVTLAVALLALAGCDRFEDPAASTPPITGGTPVPAASVQSIYVKGAPEIRVGDLVDFRTELVPDAASYRWTARGAGGVLFTASTADEGRIGRVVGLGGSQRGPVAIAVVAVDAGRRVIARGSREITVR